jgi:AcrR family transcriptional regulator
MAETIDIISKYESVRIYKNPVDIIKSDAGHQEKKSARMRLNILNATVECLAKLGYYNTTTQIVAKNAQVSRGALLHHFSTRDILVEATIDFLVSQRTRVFVTEIKKISAKERIEKGEALEFYWQQGQSTEAEALLQITFAARNDTALQSVFLPKVKAQNDFMTNIIPDIFPEWSKTDLDNMKTAQDLVNVLVIGLNIQKDVIGSKSRRVRLRKFVFDSIQSLRDNPDN